MKHNRPINANEMLECRRVFFILKHTALNFYKAHAKVKTRIDMKGKKNEQWYLFYSFLDVSTYPALLIALYSYMSS